MSVKVTSNVPQIKAEVNRNAALSLRFIVEDIQQISEPNTPMKTGDLRRNVLKQVLGLHGLIKWLKDYAIYQEAKQFTNYTTPGTGPHYAEDAVNRGVERAPQQFKRARLI